jgi:hypothetical protein
VNSAYNYANRCLADHRALLLADTASDAEIGKHEGPQHGGDTIGSQHCLFLQFHRFLGYRTDFLEDDAFCCLGSKGASRLINLCQAERVVCFSAKDKGGMAPVGQTAPQELQLKLQGPRRAGPGVGIPIFVHPLILPSVFPLPSHSGRVPARYNMGDGFVTKEAGRC